MESVVDSTTISGILIGILFIILSFHSWRYICAYKDFPLYSIHFGTIFDFLRNKRSGLPFASFFFQKFIEESKRYESEGIFLFWYLKPILFIFSEEAIKVFSNEQAALDRGYLYRVYKDVFGTGLATINGDVWKKRRKILNPVFHINVLLEKMPIFNKEADVLVEILRKYVDKPSVDLTKDIRVCTFVILCEAILGRKLDEDITNKTIELIHKLSDLNISRVFSPWLHYKFMLNFSSSGREGLRLLKERDETAKKILSLVKEPISQLLFEASSTGKDYKNITHALFDYHLKDSSITIDDIESEIIVFVTSGFVTSASTLIWCIFLLGLHEDVQERAFNEVEPTTGSYLTYENISDFKYLDCVIKETIRLYPTVPLYTRHLKKDVQYGKYKVPKDTDIAFFSYPLLRNPEVYPDPENFIPERFLDPKLEKPKWAYTAFSEGIRHCIGKKFAMMEMKVILTKILQNYKITSLDKREDVAIRWAVDLSPLKPPRMRIVPRKM